MSAIHSKRAEARNSTRPAKKAVRPKAVEMCDHRYVRLYSLHDEVNQFFGFPFVAFDDAHAKEAFIELFKDNDGKDTSCYFVGYFDVDDGSLISAKTPYEVK